MFIEQFVLASTSKIRQEILNKSGLDFIVKPSGVDESLIQAKNTKSLAYERAKSKAIEVSKQCGEKTLVLGCDQTLEASNRSFDKPQNIEQAQEQLEFLNFNPGHDLKKTSKNTVLLQVFLATLVAINYKSSRLDLEVLNFKTSVRET